MADDVTGRPVGRPRTSVHGDLHPTRNGELVLLERDDGDALSLVPRDTRGNERLDERTDLTPGQARHLGLALLLYAQEAERRLLAQAQRAAADELERHAAALRGGDEAGATKAVEVDGVVRQLRALP